MTICSIVYGRGALDPDPDPAGYPVNFVDPVGVKAGRPPLSGSR